MAETLKDRINSYQDNTDYKLLNKLPIIITINGRNFRKVTGLIQKPYSLDFCSLMEQTSMYMVKEIEGCCFCYTFNDEINFIVRNDQTISTLPWYNNKIQSICSLVSSSASINFVKSLNKHSIKLNGDPVFIANVFTVPHIQEVINYLIFKQNQAKTIAIKNIIYYYLINEYDEREIEEFMKEKSFDEKINFVKDKINKDFYSYQRNFIYGSSCYRAPKSYEGIIKNKWIIDKDVPNFSDDQEFLNNIFLSGRDIWRIGRDL
jgi:tRNA(His) 5'-end guanylyltransferase